MRDADVQRFIVDGYHAIPPSELTLGPAFHRGIIEQADSCIRGNENTSKGGLGNNALLHRVPQLKELVRDPAVDDALRTLFGKGWPLYQHSAIHDGGRTQDRGEQVSHPCPPITTHAGTHSLQSSSRALTTRVPLS